MTAAPGAERDATGVECRDDATFATLTTFRVGGPITQFVTATTQAALVRTVREADAAGDRLFLLGYGSNILAGDRGFDGIVLRPRTQGIHAMAEPATVTLTVQAGERLDALVDRCVAEGLAGIECLAGIPGSVGAAPVHNVGAYGQEIADSIVAVHAWHRRLSRVVSVDRAHAQFTYRGSRFRRDRDLVILSVTVELHRAGCSGPVRHEELARSLGIAVGDRAPLTEVRDAVLALRRAKGMLLDAHGPTRTAGSFFENPLVTATDLARVQHRVGERLGTAALLPAYPFTAGRFKLSAGWLVEHAGFPRGTTRAGAAISAMHALAVTARGGSSAGPLVDLAREVRDGVSSAFGCVLRPEPTLVGVEV